MSRVTLFLLVSLLIISIVAQRDKKKICIHNLVLDGTNLLTTHRKQLLVVGITNFSNSSSRIQANRYNDLYRELQRHDIRDSIVRLILINEKDGAAYFSDKFYHKIRIYQDNARDRIIKKLRTEEPTGNNFVFGRCGYLIYSQEDSQTDLENGRNYQDLLRVITTAVKINDVVKDYAVKDQSSVFIGLNFVVFRFLALTFVYSIKMNLCD